MTGFYTALRPLVERAHDPAKIPEPRAQDFRAAFGLGHDGTLARALLGACAPQV
jgi:hypothetical protein